MLSRNLSWKLLQEKEKEIYGKLKGSIIDYEREIMMVYKNRNNYLFLFRDKYRSKILGNNIKDGDEWD